MEMSDHEVTQSSKYLPTEYRINPVFNLKFHSFTQPNTCTQTGKLKTGFTT